MKFIKMSMAYYSHTVYLLINVSVTVSKRANPR